MDVKKERLCEMGRRERERERVVSACQFIDWTSLLIGPVYGLGQFIDLGTVYGVGQFIDSASLWIDHFVDLVSL